MHGRLISMLRIEELAEASFGLLNVHILCCWWHVYLQNHTQKYMKRWDPHFFQVTLEQILDCTFPPRPTCQRMMVIRKEKQSKSKADHVNNLSTHHPSLVFSPQMHTDTLQRAAAQSMVCYSDLLTVLPLAGIIHTHHNPSANPSMTKGPILLPLTSLGVLL